MSEKSIQILFALLRSSVLGNESQQKQVSQDDLKTIFKISKVHDIAHLVALSLSKDNVIDKQNEWYVRFQREQIMAVYRYEQLNFDYENLCAVLEKAKIPFVPLKGAVIRKFYPAPWMRTSGDVDILVHEQDLEKASQYLADALGYKFEKKTSHDISMYTPAGKHIELHYDLVEDGRAKSACKILKNVWKEVSLREGFSYWYEMSDEMYYFYHIAHMAKHFEDGGCGIRPLIDLYILDNNVEHNQKSRDRLLEKGGLLTFANASRTLSRVWFLDEKADSVSLQMQEFILRGGVYGTRENMVVIEQMRKGGKLKYALSRIFLPYDVIKHQYLILKKHRWLMPFYQVKRWCRIVFGGGMEQTVKEFNANESITQQQIDDVTRMLDSIGL